MLKDYDRAYQLLKLLISKKSFIEGHQSELINTLLQDPIKVQAIEKEVLACFLIKTPYARQESLKIIDCYLNNHQEALLGQLFDRYLHDKSAHAQLLDFLSYAREHGYNKKLAWVIEQ